MSIVLELPRISSLECSPDGSVSKATLDDYFKNIARTTSRLKLSTAGAQLDNECSLAVIAAVTAIDELTTVTFDSITTRVFSTLRSIELEARYRARELSKDIEEFFKKEIVDILLTIVGALGIPNPFLAPVPFLGRSVDGYDPKIMDLFTKEGQSRIKDAIKEDLETVKNFFSEMESVFNGDLGIISIDLQLEETWHKVKNWFNQLVNDFIGSVSEAIGNAVKNIPIIGKAIYSLVFSSIDPTISIEMIFDNLVQECKDAVKRIKQGVLSGEIIEDTGEKILRQTIDTILAINIPLIGSVRNYVNVDLNNRDIIITEFDFHQVVDAFKELIQKARRFFRGDILVKIYDIIAKAPSYILTHFPIVGTIFKALKKVVDLLSGKNPLTECDVLNIIFPDVFNLGLLIENLLPSCIEVRYIE